VTLNCQIKNCLVTQSVHK